MRCHTAEACQPPVMWRTTAQRLRFGFEAGLRVRVRGKLGVFDRDGKLQLYVDYAEPAGAGAEAAGRLGVPGSAGVRASGAGKGCV